LAGSLEIEIAGTEPGATYDRLDVTGLATLAGTLNVLLLNGFVPTSGDRFEVMRFGSRSGTFPVNNGLRVGPNLFLAPIYSATNLVLVATNATFITPTLDAS